MREDFTDSYRRDLKQQQILFKIQQIFNKKAANHGLRSKEL